MAATSQHSNNVQALKTAAPLQLESVQTASDAFEMLFSYMEALNRIIPVSQHYFSVQAPNFILKIDPNSCLPVLANESYRILEDTRATRDLLRQECDVFERRLREANTLIRLYEFQRDEARRKVEVAEHCVGEVRAHLQSNGIPIYHLHPIPAPVSVAPVSPKPTNIPVCKFLITFPPIHLIHRSRYN